MRNLLYPKIVLLLLTVSLLAQESYAEKGRLDSLLTIIEHSEGNNKADAWLDLGLDLWPENQSASLKALDSATSIYANLGMQKEWGYSLGQRVVLLTSQADFNKAIPTVALIESQLDLIDSTQFRGTLQNAIGQILEFQGKPEKAMKLFQAANETFQSVQDTLNQIRTLEAQAQIFRSDGLVDMAFEIQEKALGLELAFSKRTNMALANIYNNSGSYLLAMGRIPEAKSYIKLGIGYGRMSGDSASILFPYFTMGEINFAEDNLPAATSYFESAGKLLPYLEGVSDRSLAMEARSILFALETKFDSSEYWLVRTFEESDTAGDIASALETLALRSEVMAKLGEYERGWATFQEVARLREQWYKEEKSRQIEELRVEYKTEKSEKENTMLREANEATQSKNRRNTRFFLTIIVLVLIIVLLMSYFLWKLRKLNKKVFNKHKTLVSQNMQLKELTAENELLVGIVAHDLKAPLSKIEGLMGLLSMEGGLSDTQSSAIEMITNVLNDGKELVADILILSEAGQGRTPGLVRHELAALFEGMKDQFEKPARQKGIEIRLNRPKEPIQVLIHPPYLNRVMDNLLSNAIKFSRHQTKIDLSWGKDGEGPWCSISDQGPGIPQSEVPKLFQRFSKLSNRPTAGESSNGLGLYIVKILLDATKASIEVDTEVGKGTTFLIRFPD